MRKFITLACAAMMLAACSPKTDSMENQTNENKAIETIMSRVSVRTFTGEKISDEQIDTLLRAAMAAPSERHLCH